VRATDHALTVVSIFVPAHLAGHVEQAVQGVVVWVVGHAPARRSQGGGERVLLVEQVKEAEQEEAAAAAAAEAAAAAAAAAAMAEEDNERALEAFGFA
jgi:hypothetical protein